MRAPAWSRRDAFWSARNVSSWALLNHPLRWINLGDIGAERNPADPGGQRGKSREETPKRAAATRATARRRSLGDAATIMGIVAEQRETAHIRGDQFGRVWRTAGKSLVGYARNEDAAGVARSRATLTHPTESYGVSL